MISVEPSDQVVALAARGRQIEAIKLLRQEHGLGLKEAKEVVDALRLDDSVREVPSAGHEDRGIARLVVVLLILVAGVLTFYFL